MIAIIGVLVAAALALFALHRLDCLDGRRNRRVLPQRWWRPRWVDGVVIGTLILWYFIGAGTADDGYILGMARTAGHAGYLANYFAYFGVPETPIGIPYGLVIGWLAQISTASIVVRLPELIFCIVCWFLISREVVPRLGIAARREKAAIWAGGLALLAFWLPYDNGLRPEPAVALGVLLVWVSMERTLATRRLAPAAVALIPAALAVVTNPAGLICFAALLASARARGGSRTVDFGDRVCGAADFRSHGVDSSDTEQWVAVTPPRVPDLRTLDELVGHTRPVLLDWLVGLQFPCQ